LACPAIATGKVHNKFTPPSKPVAASLNPTTVKAHQAAHERKSNAQPGVGAAAIALGGRMKSGKSGFSPSPIHDAAMQPKVRFIGVGSLLWRSLYDLLPRIMAPSVSELCLSERFISVLCQDEAPMDRKSAIAGGRI
jgi:hypothetical protein